MSLQTTSKRSLFAGRFEIEREAGSGGTGTVYRALDRTTGDFIALKVLYATAGGQAERFVREAQLLYELRHPGIVNYICHGETTDGQCYLAMEWLEGEDLSQHIRRGPLLISDAVILMRRICEALSVAHQRGVVHRDLKPTQIASVENRAFIFPKPSEVLGKFLA